MPDPVLPPKENGNDLLSLQISESSNKSFGIEVEIFGIIVGAVYEKKDNQTKILVCSDTKNNEITFGQVIAGINKSAGLNIEDKDIQPIAKYVGIDNPQDLAIKLNTVFVYYISKDDKAPENTNAKNTEYAVSISLKNKSSEDQAAGIFTFKSLSLAVWNSTRPGVVKSLGVISIDEMLKKLNGDET